MRLHHFVNKSAIDDDKTMTFFQDSASAATSDGSKFIVGEPVDRYGTTPCSVLNSLTLARSTFARSSRTHALPIFQSFSRSFLGGATLSTAVARSNGRTRSVRPRQSVCFVRACLFRLKLIFGRNSRQIITVDSVTVKTMPNREKTMIYFELMVIWDTM